MLAARHFICAGRSSSRNSSCQQLSMDFDAGDEKDYENDGRHTPSTLQKFCGPGAGYSDSVDSCLTIVGRRSSNPINTLNTDEVDHFMVKSASAPADRKISLLDTPDPFPEISRSSLTLVSARLYWPDPNWSSPSSSRGLESSRLLDSDSPEELDSKRSSLPKQCLQQKVYVQFYNNDQSCHSIEIKPEMTVSDVCNQLVILNHAHNDIHWTIVEHIEKPNLERSLEDHELLYQVYRAWGSSCIANRFYFRKDFTRYELFQHPNQYFPEQMVDVKLQKDESLAFTSRYEHYKNFLLQNLLANQTLPDIQGFLQIREGKRSWKKYFCLLRKSGLYLSTKGSLKDPVNLVLLSHLNEANVYLVCNAKKLFNAPNNFCFCLKPPCDVTDHKELKLFCAEDEQSRLCWMTGLRFIKHGSQLRENFRAKVKFDNRLQSIENKGNKSMQEVLYGKNCVAMDFSGDRGHVVEDPNEALSIEMEEGHSWRIKACRQQGSVATQSVARLANDSASRPTMTEIHLTQPWFYGHFTRQEATKLIEQQGLINGVFVVRRSQTMPGVHVLSFAHNHKVKHCPIHRVEDKDQVYVTLDNGTTKFMDLIQLVDFYQLNAGFLPTRLTHHVTKLL